MARIIDRSIGLGAMVTDTSRGLGLIAPRPLFFGQNRRIGLGGLGAVASFWSDGLPDGPLANDTTYSDTSGRVWTYGPVGAMQQADEALSISIMALTSRAQIEAKADAATSVVKPAVIPAVVVVPKPAPTPAPTPAAGEDHTAIYVAGGVAALVLVGGVVYLATRKKKGHRRGYSSYGSPAYNPRRRSRRRGRR